MQTILLLLALPGFASAPATPRENALMDAIESAVHLPAGAMPIDHYARYYTLAGPDDVRAIYVRPFPAPNPRSGCEVMLANSKSRPCTRREIAEGKSSDAAAAARGLPAGARRWVNDPRAVPGIFDGGCNQVTITYSITLKAVTAVRCNGVA